MNVTTQEDFEKYVLKTDARIANLEALVRLAATPVKTQWVSIEVAQLILDVSRSTIYELRKSNRLAFQQTNRKVKISLQSIRDYLAQNRYDPTVIELTINRVLCA
jgi:excisionase family DNA binding protein